MDFPPTPSRMADRAVLAHCRFLKGPQMYLPSTRNVVNDTKTGVRYVVLAYRALTRSEAMAIIRAWLGASRVRPKRGETYIIGSVIGARDRPAAPSRARSAK